LVKENGKAQKAVKATERSYRPRKIDAQKEEQWRATFVRFRNSGLSFRNFCAEEKISPNTFQYWRRELRKRDNARGTASEITKGCNLPADLESKKTNHWLRIIDEINAYEGSVNSYCRNNGVSSGSLHFWEKRLMKMKLTDGVRRHPKPNKPVFVPVQISGAAESAPISDACSKQTAESSQRIEVKLPNDIVMSFPLTTGIDTLVQLINGLAR